MIVCIDSGNSRIKWGAYAAGQWLETGAVSHAEVSALADLPTRLQPTQVIFANVAGAGAAAAIRATLIPWQEHFVEASSSAAAAGVRNGYENPQQLGVDRWCALLGARRLSKTACLVVMAGTATTIDTLDAQGNFCGGLILPGLDLMRRSLARDTAALPLACGQHAAQPKNTNDAIVSGCLEAQAGAIERAFARIAGESGAVCLLSGGAGASIAPLLRVPCQVIDSLVLDGLCRLATYNP